MSEMQLQKTLMRARMRWRLDRALTSALGALGGSLLIAALVMGTLRLSGYSAVFPTLLIALPLGAMALAGSLAFWICRPSLMDVAELLDRRASLAEHVTTWLYLRELNETTPSAAQRGFRSAQRESALRAADSIVLKNNLPFHWPAWTRAIWLAMILVLSAIVLPTNEARLFKMPERGASMELSADSGNKGKIRSASDQLRELPKVQVLSPAELHKFKLIVSDPELSPERKTAALKELSDAVGGISESELTPDVRELFEMLRKDASVKSDAQALADGSIQVNATQENERSKAAVAAIKAAEFKAFESADKAAAVSEPQFDDVRMRLQKYYGH